MITKDKVAEIFCMADDFCKFFDAMTAKYTLKPTGKRKYHRNSTMSKAEVMLIMILFHDSGYRCFIETVNDELKNISQVEHSIHRYFDRFIINLLLAITTYFLFPKKRPSMHKASFTLPLHRSESVERRAFVQLLVQAERRLHSFRCSNLQILTLFRRW